MKSGAMAAAWALCAAIAAGGSGRAFEVDIDSSSIQRAIAMARAGDRQALRSFHDAYQVPLGDPLLERLETITEFRRVVLAAEERLGFGDHAWNAPQATELLRPFRQTVTIVLHVAFSPNNAYRVMPDFGIVVHRRPPASEALRPRDVQQIPRYLPGQVAPPGSPMLGGRVEAIFDAKQLDRRAVYLAGITMDGRELRRVEIDFGRIE